ncbi:unnamed protein product [Euphydryas editha]|uniref:Protein kinase domain-containing protein n=1 Tax=Euphydryas editha TaxID=104508 RepID=A0AAU9UPW7_EUPED|nr:unnamed protein product [Euphydryas editha]
MLLTLAIAAIGATAIYCKRRAELKYRSCLEALGLHSMLPKTIGLDRWEIPRERVVINRKLGMGAFGTVYVGYALLAEDCGWTAVAVKSLKAGARTEEKLDFLSEAEAMKRFDHKNVVRLLAVVTKTEPVCTVMKYMLHGDLKNYLLARRHLAYPGASAGEDVEEQVSARRLTSMELDVARALSYLAQLRYVHCDVAARNCLPERNASGALDGSGESLPRRTLVAFGVLLYEIVTFGSLPFQGLSNGEVLSRVKGGQTLELPIGLKPQLEGLTARLQGAAHGVRGGCVPGGLAAPAGALPGRAGRHAAAGRRARQRKLALFANDAAIYSSDTSVNAITKRLQSAVTALGVWFRNWKIEVNPMRSH